MPLDFNCGNPPDGFVGIAYSHTFLATGGTPPYVYEITSGALPDGLSLDEATGILSGVPTDKGTFPFSIMVTDEDDVTITVNCSIRITGACLLPDNVAPGPVE